MARNIEIVRFYLFVYLTTIFYGRNSVMKEYERKEYDEIMMNFVQVRNRLPEDIALKISTEYFPAPDSEQDRVFFRITINQTTDCFGFTW